MLWSHLDGASAIASQRRLLAVMLSFVWYALWPLAPFFLARVTYTMWAAVLLYVWNAWRALAASRRELGQAVPGIWPVLGHVVLRPLLIAAWVLRALRQTLF